MKFSVHSFGCRLNQAEVLSWIKELKSKGYHYTKNVEESSVHIVNTCTLTERADRDVRKYIKKFSQKYSEKTLILTGCFVEHYKNELKSTSNVLFLSNSEKEKIPELFKGVKEKKFSLFRRDYRLRGFLKINDGCNFRCSYCIIPYVRGRAKRREPKDIEKDFKYFLESGYREIVLSGINITYYGKEKKPYTSLRKLLERLLEYDGDYILRLSSLDPRFTDDELVEFVVEEERIAPHFHISIQNGSEKILRDMNRPFSVEKYHELINRLKKKKNVLVSADYIVGYPTENEKDFSDGFKFLESSKIDYLHIFPFSPRPGTKAYSLKELDEKVLKEREKILREFHRKRYSDFKARFKGKVLRSIAISKKKVLTENYIYVELNGEVSENELGNLLSVVIIDVGKDGKAVGEIKK